MKSSIVVNRLNKSGRYISELDTDKAFITEDNTKGQFKIVVEPMEGEIIYEKLDNGYLVKGEGYIITGSESKINEDIRKYFSYRIRGTKHTLVERDR